LRRGIGPFVMQTSVGTDVTGPAIHEALAEIHAIAADRLATGDEVGQAFASLSKGYPRGFETAGQVARSVAQLALHNLPDTYFEEFVPRLARVPASGDFALGQCVRLALRLGRGDAGARAEFLRLSGVTLLIVLPIVPIQPLFGVVGAGLSVIALLAVGLGGRASDTASVRAE